MTAPGASKPQGNGAVRSKADPVAVFFGPTGPGPFALLALEATELQPAQVLEAMQFRLEQLARHPQNATPAADEVRLALHAAAAQLCDPAVRRLLLGMWSGGRAAGGEAPETARARASDSNLSELEGDLRIAIGLSGGWNAAAMRRMAIACQARGASADDVALLLRTGVREQPAAKVRVRHQKKVHRDRVVPNPVSSQVSEVAFRWDLMLLVAFGVLTVISVLAVVIMLTPAKPVSAPSRASSPSSSLPLASTEPRKEPAPASAPGLSEFPGDLQSGDPRAITLEIVGAAQDLTTDAKVAGERFARAYAAFGKSWTLLQQDEIASIVSAIVDYVFAASRQDVAVAPVLASALASPKWGEHGGVRGLGASDGVVARLLAERDLPRNFLDELRSMATVAGSRRSVEPALSFRTAVERALPDIGGAIAEFAPQSVQAWREFVEVRDAVLGDKQSAKDQVTIGVLDLLLHEKGGGAGLGPGVQVLASALSWHPGEELRNAVFGWIEDMAVPSELIAQVTKAMVASSAPGVDSTMMLPIGAGPELRTALRERLAQVWQGAAPVPADVISAWQSRAGETLALTAESPLEKLQLASRLSLLTLSADLLLQARPDEAQGAIKESQAAAGSQAVQLRALVPVPVADPHSPAIEFAQAGISVQGRLEAIKKMQASSAETDALLARTLVIEASRGSPASVRDAARTELRRRLNAPSVLLATIEFLRMMPETPENADWVSDLAGKPGAWKSKPKWKSVAELALLNRACEQFPVSPEEAALNAGSEQLAMTWWRRTGEADAPGQLSPAEAIDRLEVSLGTVTRPIGAAAGLSPIEIRRRLAARLSIAPTSLEQTVARQAACLEWMALATLHDRARTGEGVRLILADWNGARQKSRTSIEQLLEGERAMLKLQILRLSAGGKS